MQSVVPHCCEQSVTWNQRESREGGKCTRFTLNTEEEEERVTHKAHLHRDKGGSLYLCVEDGHNSVFGFPHILPLPAHLDVRICREKGIKKVKCMFTNPCFILSQVQCETVEHKSI